MAGTSLDDQAANKAALARALLNLNAMLAAIGLGSAKGLLEVAEAARTGVIAELSHHGSGATYFIRTSAAGHRYWSTTPPGIMHQASAPGQPPAVDTGKYRATWKADGGIDAAGPFSRIYTADKRAMWLEFGTRNMKPRPHIRPVILAMTATVQGILAESVVVTQTQVLSRLRAATVAL